MARVFVVGHCMSQGGQQVHVPRGVTLHFHAEQNLASLQALMARGLASSSFEEYSLGSLVDNYLLMEFTDTQKGAFLTTVKDESELLLVGDANPQSGQVGLPGQIQLCHTPEVCGPHGHSCNGLFGLLSPKSDSQTSDDNDKVDIYILSCPLNSGDESSGGAEFLMEEEVDDDFTQQRDYTVGDLLELAKMDTDDETREEPFGGFILEQLEDPEELEQQETPVNSYEARLQEHIQGARDVLRQRGALLFYLFHLV